MWQKRYFLRSLLLLGRISGGEGGDPDNEGSDKAQYHLNGIKWSILANIWLDLDKSYGILAS